MPDPAAVRLCIIPDSAPPYDADAAEPPGSVERQGAPDKVGSPGPRRSSATPAVPATPATPVTPGSRGLPGAPAPPPGWPGQFAQVLAETLAGARSPRQLVPWTTERARERIQRLGPQLSAGQQPRVRRVMTCRPTADAIEMTVVVGFGTRVHALAVRLERAGRRPEAAAWAIRPGRQERPGQPGPWLCVAVEAA